jgi:dTDP-4-amino-4,6-dideoxygalactose transaminase
MTNLQAAVAVAQVEQIDEILAARKRIEACYDRGLEGIKGITRMPAREVLWMYDLRADNRDELMKYLHEGGIETRLFFQPMSRQPMYYNADWSSLNAARFAADGLYLPTYVGLTEEDQDKIVARIRAFYNH